jgi:hypothetical protein
MDLKQTEFHSRPHPYVVGERIGDEILLVHLRTNQIYELNSTAARVWELVQAGCQQEEIQQRIREEFEVGDAQLVIELEGFLSLLRSKKLLISHDSD